jgi:superfamily II DNA/RNA helicase
LRAIVELKYVCLSQVKYFVLDEADHMLNTCNWNDVYLIVNEMKNNEKSTFLFSATFNNKVQNEVKTFLKSNHLKLTIGTVGEANSNIKQIIYDVGKSTKQQKLLEIINSLSNQEKVMIFVERKIHCDALGFFLIQKGILSVSTIHGDRLQSQREEDLKDFQNGKIRFLVCTSLVSRGLDISKVDIVINYDLPSHIDAYVQRIGRTSRCGNHGLAYSFFDKDCVNDIFLSKSLVRIMTKANQTVPYWLHDITKQQN